MRDRLARDFDDAVQRALAAPGARPVGAYPLHLPPAVRETLVAAAELGAPEAEAYYTQKMPGRLVEQLFVADDAGARLLHRPFEAAPRLREALAGAHAALTAEGLDPAALFGAPTTAALLHERPTVARLAAPSLFCSGLPVLGAMPNERELLAGELARGVPPDEVIDRRLSGNLVHELCHGVQREMGAAPPPWMILEAAAIHLGAAARSAHVFPDEPGEAVPGVSAFVAVADALARSFGRRALWRMSLGATLAEAFGDAAAVPLEVAAWQAWLRRREAPFVADALDWQAWAKLGDGARAGMWPVSPGDAPRAAPDLLALAARTPWRELPSWRAEPGEADARDLERGVLALCQVNVIAPNFQTHPSEPPEGQVLIDVEACELAARARPKGVFGEPARWPLPPALGRRLAERGATRVVVGDVTRAGAAGAARRLLDLTLGGDGPLPREARA